jgi:hypothetical protein
MTAKKIITTGALAMLLIAGPAFAQTSTSSTTDDLTTPGTPNTGSGGNAAANVLLLTGSAAVALGGLAMLSRRRTL